MPKISSEAVNARRDEIIAACESLYQTMGFKDVTLKEVSKLTSLSRPSIYNYFETKEEIFVAILQREYELWAEDLNKLLDGHEKLAKDELANSLAASLEKRHQLLKLLSMNHFDMETNSRTERLIPYKEAYANSFKTVDCLLQKFCPELTLQDRQAFLYAFFPFLYGVYPYTEVTEKQKAEMDAANVGFVYLSVYEIIYRCIKKLLE